MQVTDILYQWIKQSSMSSEPANTNVMFVPNSRTEVRTWPLIKPGVNSKTKGGCPEKTNDIYVNDF